MKIIGIHIVALLGAFGCGGAAESGNSELGIARFEVTETQSELSVRGLDADGNAIGTLTVQRGHVVLPESELAGLGRRVTVDVGGSVLEHASLGFEQVRVPMAGTTDELEAFVADSEVSEPLARWKVALVAQELGAETGVADPGYSACTFGGCASSSTLECCMNSSAMESRVCSLNRAQLATRHCPGAPGCVWGGTYPACEEGPGYPPFPGEREPVCPTGSSRCAAPNAHLCCSTASGCTNIQIGAAGCGVCSQVSNTNGSWNVTDGGSTCTSSSCGAFLQACCDDSWCGSDLTCAGGFCRANDGQACAADDECAGGHCNPASGICGDYATCLPSGMQGCAGAGGFACCEPYQCVSDMCFLET